MAVVNILKDGTVVEDMSKVTVPNEIMRNIHTIYQNRGKHGSNAKKERIISEKKSK